MKRSMRLMNSESLKKLPSNVNENGMTGRPAAPTVAPGAGAVGADLQRPEVDVAALGGARDLDDQRRDVVVARDGLAEARHRGVVGGVLALRRLGRGQRRLRRRELGVGGLDLRLELRALAPLGGEGEEVEGAQD